MPARPPKETNQLAKYILEVTTGETEKIKPPVKNAAAVALGRLGGLKGGKARTQKLSAKKRKALAKNAANSRWANREPKPSGQSQ